MNDLERRLGRAMYQNLRPEPKRLDEASIADVKAHKASQIKSLRENIARYKQFIADAEAKIKEWEATVA